MSIFGSREDDPLLQNDPLAPSPDDDPAGDTADEDGDASESDRSSTARNRSEAPADEDASTDSAAGPATSVFGSPAGVQGRSSSRTDERVIVRLVEEAANGRLAQVNTALDAGWRLRRLELRDEVPDGRVPTTADSPQSVAFVLYRPGS